MHVTGILLAAVLSATSPELAILEQARVALGAGETKRAAALAERAMRSGAADIEKSLPVHRGAQDVLLAAGATENLVAFYDGLLREDATSPIRRYLRARVEPDPARRRDEIESVFVSSPGLFWAAYDLAELYAREGDWLGAARWARRAVVIRPEEAAAWNVLGHLRLEASRFLEDVSERKRLARRARGALSRVVDLNPDLAEAHYNLGLVNFALGDPAAARSQSPSRA